MTLEQAIKNTARKLINTGQEVESKSWQGIESPKNMWETLFVDIHAQMVESRLELVNQVKPNLPWADEHFEERIGGMPLNPGESYKTWPFYGRDSQMRPDLFSHTYMERFWPKYAGAYGGDIKYKELSEHGTPFDIAFDPDTSIGESGPPNYGIHYPYGDLDGVVKQLQKDSHTRQAYLPIWFPEDTGATDRRVPCTLGYHFIIRNGFIHMTYYIRSCDLLRHFQDDIYLAVRLVDYVRSKLGYGNTLQLGQFNMHIGSLHIFKPEINRVKQQFGL